MNGLTKLRAGVNRKVGTELELHCAKRNLLRLTLR